MIKHLLAFSSLVILFNSCAQAPEKKIETKKKPVVTLPTIKTAFVLSDFLTENKQLDQDVEAIFKSLDDTAIVAQLLMPAIGRLGQTEETITKLICARKIGGLLMLNGTKEGFTSWISNFNAMNDSIGNVPFLYSADAEPSLVNRKIIGSTPVKKANELKNIDEVIACADTISMNLKAIGINYNFAPVVDMSPNKTVGFRSFGAVPANIIPWSNAFIMKTQKNGIIATAKHFPGHGLVSGDTHKSLQMIDGELKEIKNYPKLIQDGVLSIMIGHLAVANNAKYNTKGLPATLSSVIVTDLLRKEMGFKGLIVTDAMNMGGVTAVPQCDMKAVEAGNDIVLMPVNADKAFADILKKYRSNAEFKSQVDESAQRIIRMKLCVGAIESK
jgi:beta-N-acetylhexosaminidase